jgi:hypothetical protein
MSAYFCPHCKVMATFESGGPGWTWNNRAHFVWRCHNCNGLVYAMVEAQTAEAEIWPSLRSEAPEELPEVVRDNLSEAIRSVNANSPRAAVVMTRSALQAATREQGAQGKNLREEIDDLVQKHVIPESLGTWAHEIRDGGNLVAHPEPGKQVLMADAEELMALAESVFEYLYVVPKQVERRRERLAAEQSEDASAAALPTQETDTGRTS